MRVSLNVNRVERLGKAMVIGACAAAMGPLSLASAQAQAPQIIVRCVAPLVLSEDGTDCVRPAVAPKTPDRLTAFAIKAGDGSILGLFRKIGSDTWMGPSLDSGDDVAWLETDADSSSLVLYTEVPRIRTLVVYDDATVSSSGLPGGSVVYESAY